MSNPAPGEGPISPLIIPAHAGPTRQPRHRVRITAVRPRAGVVRVEEVS